VNPTASPSASVLGVDFIAGQAIYYTQGAGGKEFKSWTCQICPYGECNPTSLEDLAVCEDCEQEVAGASINGPSLLLGAMAAVVAMQLAHGVHDGHR
jgi:hypothetical protein